VKFLQLSFVIFVGAITDIYNETRNNAAEKILPVQLVKTNFQYCFSITFKDKA